MVKFIESKTAPSPKEYTYWVDLTENSHCGVIKYFNGSEWESISGDSEQNSEIQQIKNQLNNKVDKVSGKQLSTNDYTTSEKQKLASLSNTVVVNNLTTTTTTSALSAAQGKVLKDALDALAARVAALETPAA